VAGAGGEEGAVEAVGTVANGVVVELGAEVGAHLDQGGIEAVGLEVGEQAGQGEGAQFLDSSEE
jgi:hypothetical protein